MDKDYLIKKWLDNDLSETEFKAFEALEDVDLYKEIIEEAQRFSGESRAKVDDFEALEQQLENKRSSSFNWMNFGLKIAAALVVGIAIFTLIDKDNINSFQTDYAQNETITLPDNSIVKLNERSQLEYNASKWDEKRTIELKGEAFFDVEKGKRFDVTTEFGKVSVLGTEFKVLSRDSIFKVSCYEGLVKVVYGNENIKLPAGNEFILSAGKAKKTAIVIAEPYWLKNMSVFENASLDHVIHEIEKRFDVTILKAFDKNDVKFTGAFEHKDLENALKSVTQPLNLTYEIKNDKEVTIKNAKE
jgi:ferric-dicitrate binding protein FerR (iron transport regulator)